MPQKPAPAPVRRAAPQPRQPAPARGSKLFYAVLILLGVLVLSFTAYSELQASRLQARYFAGVARDMKFAVHPGPSTSIRYPQAGPYDHRLGYSDLPVFIKRLQGKGYEIESQARVTRQLADLIQAGYAPPYPEKAQAGLQLQDCRNDSL